MDYFEESSSKLKKLGIAGIFIALAIITMINSCSIVQQRERGVKYVLGKVVGQYSIYELVEKQAEVTEKVAKSILARMHDYPITISQTTITNWDWSDDFDRQIKETANRTQQVK